jgi:hypothetical protein
MTYANGAAGDGDHDVDGYVDAMCANTDAMGHVFHGTDCADIAPASPIMPFTMSVAAASVHPTQSEICNGVDDDCNGLVDDGLVTHTYYPDCDGDHFGDASAMGMTGCRPDEFPACNGHVWVLDHTDCNDASNLVHRGATEVCDGLDNDCNGTIDDQPAANMDCAMRFPSTPNGTVTCSATTHACTLGCSASFADCNTTIADGCEVDLRTDAAHCGTCANACAIAATCSAMSCERLGAIDCGAAFSCAIYGSSGHAVCWGENNEGQLGDGTLIERHSAVAVAPPVGGVTLSFATIDAGGSRHETDLGTTDRSHTCAATRAGDAIYCWGRGIEGQLGNSGFGTLPAPVLTAIIPMASAGSTGTPTLIGVTTGDTWSIGVQREPERIGASNVIGFQQWAWGQGATEGAAASPVPVRTIATTTPSTTVPAIRSLSAGLDATCYIDVATNAVYCGGIGAAPSVYGLPAGWTGATQVSTNGVSGFGSAGPYFAGGNSTCVLGIGTSAGQVACTGSLQGVIPGLSDATQITVGGRHACALRATGAVVCWGDNQRGELGGGGGPPTFPPWSTTPYPVSGITNAVQISAGTEHTCALLADRSVWCWGMNDHGQLGSSSTGAPARVVGI